MHKIWFPVDNLYFKIRRRFQPNQNKLAQSCKTFFCQNSTSGTIS